jgi:hypothetical protein
MDCAPVAASLLACSHSHTLRQRRIHHFQITSAAAAQTLFAPLVHLDQLQAGMAATPDAARHTPPLRARSHGS